MSSPSNPGNSRAFLAKFGVKNTLWCVLAVVLFFVSADLQFSPLPIGSTGNDIIVIGMLVVALAIAIMTLKRNKKIQRELMPVPACPNCGLQFSPYLKPFKFCPKCGALVRPPLPGDGPGGI